MAYTPNAEDVDRPVLSDTVRVTEELRAIKVRLQAVADSIGAALTAEDIVQNLANPSADEVISTAGLDSELQGLEQLIPLQSSKLNLNLGGDFLASQLVNIRKIGDIVVLASEGKLSHTNGAEAASASQVIPSEFRPPFDYKQTVGIISNNSIMEVEVTTLGDIKIQYFNDDDLQFGGISKSETNAAFFFAYPVV